MNDKLKLIVPIVFGLGVALLAVLDSPIMPWFAAIGGVLIGLMYTVFNKPRSDNSAR